MMAWVTIMTVEVLRSHRTLDYSEGRYFLTDDMWGVRKRKQWNWLPAAGRTEVSSVWCWEDSVAASGWTPVRHPGCPPQDCLGLEAQRLGMCAWRGELAEDSLYVKPRGWMRFCRRESRGPRCPTRQAVKRSLERGGKDEMGRRSQGGGWKTRSTCVPESKSRMCF